MHSSDDTPPVDPHTVARRSPWRDLLRGAGVASAGFVGLALALVVLLQIDAVGTAVARWALPRAAPPGLDVSLDRASGSWLRSLTLTGLRLTGADGSVAARIDTLSLTWSPLALLDRRIALGRVRAGGVEAHLVRDSTAAVRLRGSRPAPPPPDTVPASRWTVTVDSATVVGVDGDLRTAGDSLPTLTWADAGVRISGLRAAGDVSVTLDSAFARLDAPGIAGTDGVGPVDWTAAGRLEPGRLQLDTMVVHGADGSRLEGAGSAALPSTGSPPGPLSFEVVAEGFSLALVHGALGRRVADPARVDGVVRVSGTTAAPSVAVDLRVGAAGRVSGSAGAALGDGPTRFEADLTVAALDPGPILADSAWSGRIDGRLSAALDGPRASRLDGRVDLSLDAVRIGALPLRSARLTSAWTEGSAALDLSAEGEPGSIRLAGSARPLDSLPTYDVAGPFVLDLRSDSGLVATASGRLRLEGSGVRPGDADLRARLDVASLDVGEVGIDTAHVRAHLRDGSLEWSLEARDPAAGTVRAAGRAVPGSPTTVAVDSAVVRDFDIAGLLGDSVASRVDGRLEATATLGAPERTAARFDLVVREARYGAVQVDSAVADGRLLDGRLDADVRLRSTAGTAEGSVAVRPFDDVPALTVQRLAFADVDAGAWAPPRDSLPTTRLTGRLEGQIRGRSAETARGDFTLQLDTSRVNRQEVAGGEAAVRLDAGRIDFEADLRLPDSGELTFTGRARPFGTVPEIVVDRLGFSGLDPFALSGTAAPVDARLTGVGSGTVRGFDPATVDGDLRLELGPSRLNRETLETGRVEATVRAGRLEAAAAAELAEGAVSADVVADWSGERPSWRVDGRLRSEAPLRLADVDTVGGHLDLALFAEGRGATPATLDARFRVAADSALLGDVRVDTLRFSGRVSEGFAVLDTLVVRSNVADLRGEGRVALVDSATALPSDLEIVATLGTLTPLESVLGLGPLGVGEGELRAAVSGRPGALAWTASARTSALLLGTAEVLGLDGRASGELGPDLSPETLDGTLSLDRLTFAGVDVAGSTTVVRWDGEVAVIEGEATVDDRRDVSFAVRADPLASRPRADLDRFDVRVDGDRWSLSGTPSVAWGDGIEFDELALSAGSQSLVVDGRFDLAGASDLSLRLDSLRLGGLTDLVGLERLDGALTLRLDLRGSAADPRLDGEIDAALVQDGRARSSVKGVVSYDSLLLRVDVGIDAEGGGGLEVVGSVPVDLALTPAAEGDSTRLARAAEGAVDLRVRADSFAVRWVEPFLDPTTVRGLAGHLEIDARVEGSQASPSLGGRARLRDGRLTLPALGVTYDRAVLDVALEGDRARIDTARVHTDDGSLSLEGGVDLRELSLGEFDVRARLDRFRAIHNDAFRVRMSGTAELVGTTSEPRLEGDLRLLETDIYLDDAIPSGASVRPVELTDEQIRELEEYLGFSVSRPEREAGALFDALTIELDVSASRDTWVRQRANPQLEIQVTGEATVTKQPRDSLRFDGRIEAVARRSWVEQFGRRFSIQEGVVELQGTAAESRVDVQAVYEVPSTNDTEPEATITLDVEGTLDDLSLTLGSEPSMENADIVSYLATGRPASSSLDFRSDEGGGGGLRSIGSEFALGQVTGLVEGLAAEGVGLDVVEIRTDGLRGATLIAGRYVRPELYVGFKQPVGRDPDDPTADSGADRTEVEIELQALRWLLLNMEASNSAVSFLFRFRYAY